MDTVTSADGTRIAFDRTGAGRPLIVVLGAFNTRTTHAEFAAALSEHFTVYNYDRRGRGDSGDTAPWSIDKELQDIAALLAHAGEGAAVFGYSSGAVLALKAAATLPVHGLAVYEAPINAESSTSDLPRRLAALIADGKRGEAVELFQLSIGIPRAVVDKLRHAPFRPQLEEMAHTLVYDTSITAEPSVLVKDVPSIGARTLALAGGASPGWMADTARTIADTVPDGTLRLLAGQGHDIVPEVMTPVLRDFFAG